ncbi:MAG: hypothetical protein AAF636_13185 [Pseudomonadota bacterium]
MPRFRLTGIRFDGGETYTVTQGGETVRYPEQTATMPAQMGPPSLVALSLSSFRATLAGPPDNGGSPITGYDLRYSTDQTNWTEFVDIETQTTLTGLTGNTYFVQSRAKNNVNPVPNNWSNSAQVTLLPDSGGATVTIETDRTNAPYNTAPAGFMFKATVSGAGNADARELRYEWSFDDPDAQPITDFNNNFSDEFGWNDTKKAYLDTAVHVFSPTQARFGGAASRDYTVTCTVHDAAGLVGVGQITVTVDNPDTVYSGTKTALVAADGDFSEVSAQYPSAAQFTDLGSAYSSLGDDGRILLKPDRTYALPFRPRNKRSIQIGGWNETSPKAVIDITQGEGGIVNRGNVGELCVHNLLFKGDWNVFTESAPSGITDRSAFSFFSNTTEDHQTIYRCDGEDLNSMFLSVSGNSTSNNRKHIYVQKCTVDRYRDYGCLLSTTYRFGAKGWIIRCDVGGRQGGKLNKTAHAHSSLRASGPQANSWNVFDLMELFSLQGWTGMGSYEDIVGQTPAPQSCVRWNPGTADVGFAQPAPARMSRMVMEGGNTPFLGASAYGATTSADMQFDKLVVICGSSSASGIGFGHRGGWLSNALVIIPSMLMTRAKDFSNIVSMSGNSANPSKTTGVTVLNWLDPTADRHEASVGNPVDLGAFDPNTANETYEGNIVHAPKLLSPIDNSAGLDLTQYVQAPLWPGMNFFRYDTGSNKLSQTPYVNTAYAARDDVTGIPGQKSVVVPRPLDSSQFPAGGEEVPVDDIYGNLRPTDGTASRGAVEPTSI